VKINSVEPVEMRVERIPLLLLSATDSCRDRPAAFFHWKDRQALAAAVAIGTRHALDLETIRTRSEKGGAGEAFEEFRRRLEAAKGAAER
jgi:hypothetical protein